jgi:TolA-binding protein
VLRAGQSLSVGLRPEPFSIPEVAQSPEAPGVLAPAHALEHRSAPSGAVAARTRSAPSAPTRWSQDLDEDRAGAIVAAAETLGIQRVLRESSSQELSALADAARYKHRYTLARQALTAQMRRFPASPRARDAAFFLGRLCEDAEDRLEDALGFYNRYLQATPDGTYAAEALGRKMMVLERSARQDEARVIAADYLRLYPKGPYAYAARALARVP